LIKMKSDTTARAGAHPVFRQMVRNQQEWPEEVDAVYCCRVVAEGVISALERLFGHTVASRKRHNKNVEVLCRLVLWNHRCLHLD
jgi:hypothetical protein